MISWGGGGGVFLESTQENDLKNIEKQQPRGNVRNNERALELQHLETFLSRKLHP